MVMSFIVIKEVNINNWPGMWVFCSVTTLGSDMFWKWFKRTMMCHKLCVSNVWPVKGRGSSFLFFSPFMTLSVLFAIICPKLVVGLQCKYCSSESHILVCHIDTPQHFLLPIIIRTKIHCYTKFSWVLQLLGFQKSILKFLHPLISNLCLWNINVHMVHDTELQ